MHPDLKTKTLEELMEELDTALRNPLEIEVKYRGKDGTIKRHTASGSDADDMVKNMNRFMDDNNISPMDIIVSDDEE